ncbi:unnamed protein product [Penicillium salamii]|uniref:Protein kinase domain-containing protein n=1 Tax=Penicillium salamii TaxID=1612424 RepID=A0A9W4ITN4_9EURO|nr:unnamed protein product [Penicillium salamii]CAG8043973.1 unnamed protein product [Penicillium salamii]CAG8334731.1 unnamed protein product [Penicillium salamii]CAG8334986.1 unnamed protein product [Penicillium salamii]CAG8343428.1 unnamed protein product [Penicillium salamii]
MERTELVNDMKLNADIRPDQTSHSTFQPDYARGATGKWHRKVEVWKRGKILGSGSFGTVWVEECVSSEGPTRVRAVKMIKKPSDPSYRIYCDQELEAIAKFSQPKYSGLFIKCFGWFENQESIFIAMEHIEFGDLQEHLQGPLRESEARQICFQILHGLQSLHENQFVHRDLKPQNVFVKSKGPHWHVKIGDFGFSKRYTEKTTLQSKVGTQLYLAPELLRLYPPGFNPENLRHYTSLVDTWSLGVMLFYLLCHDYPFTREQTLSSFVQTSSFPSWRKLQSVSKEGLGFIKRLLVADPTMRLSAKEALREGWLKEFAFDATSGMSRMAISENDIVGSSPLVVASNVTGTTDEASQGWDDRNLSSAMASERKTRPVQEMPAISPAKQQTSSISLGDLHATHDSAVRLMDQKNYADAEKLFREAFELGKLHLGAHHEDTLASLEGLGDALGNQQKLAEAEAIHRDAWLRRKRALGEAHKDTIASLDSLADVLRLQEKLAEAEPIYSELWRMEEQAFGESHAYTLNSLGALANVFVLQHKMAEAEAIYREIWTRRKRTVGEDDTETLEYLQLYGRVLSLQDKDIEAESVLRDVWESKKNSLGEHHEETLSCLESVADVLFDQGKWAEAEPLYREILEQRKSSLGAHHEETLNSLHYLGRVMLHQDRFFEAEQIFREAWKGRKETLGEEDGHTLRSLLLLGDAVFGQRKLEQAEAIYRDVWNYRKWISGEAHEDTLSSALSTGHALYRQKKYKESEDIYRDVWKSRKRYQGSHDAKTLLALDSLGDALYKQSKYVEAEEVWRRVWEGRKQTLGEHHSDTVTSRRQMNHCRARQRGKDREAKDRDKSPGKPILSPPNPSTTKRARWYHFGKSTG